MTTDTVEWTFDDKQQMSGERINKLTVLGFDRGGKKSNVFNAKRAG